MVQTLAQITERVSQQFTAILADDTLRELFVQQAAQYDVLKLNVLKQHTDRTKAPDWLNVENNICPHFYFNTLSIPPVY
jgi:hypothetical protein